MPDPFAPFPNSVFPVDVTYLAAHANAATCVLAGRRGPVTIASADQCVSGDVLLIRPGVEHTVTCAQGGADVLYLDGLALPESLCFAQALEGSLARIASDAVDRSPQSQQELRARVAHGSCACPSAIAEIICDLATDPMERMTQVELGKRLNMERTRALRYFKAATGQTFRGYKQWAGLRFAACGMMRGESVRTAAMDAGFSDTAHLSRTFRHIFGLTPSVAIAALTPDAAQSQAALRPRPSAS